MSLSIIWVGFIGLLLTSACAAGDRYITAEELNKLITNSAQLSIIDIQFEGADNAGHFPEALAMIAVLLRGSATTYQSPVNAFRHSESKCFKLMPI